MAVVETVTLMGALSAAISGPEIVKSMVGGLIGDGSGAVVKRLSQSLYTLATGAQNENTLVAMHDCFVDSMKAMAKACESAGGDAKDHFAREALRNFSGWKGFSTLPAAEAERLVGLLDGQVRAIFGQQGQDVRAAATDQVISSVEAAIGCALTPPLREVFHKGRGNIAGWAFEFETRFAKKLEASKVFNVLVVDRLNEIVATVGKVADKQDHLIALYERKDGERFLERWARGELEPEEQARVDALTVGSKAAGGDANPSDIAEAAIAVGALERSNDPERREVAELIEAGQGREGAARLAASARGLLEGQKRDAAESFREAARVARLFSAADALGYFREAARLDPDDVGTWIEVSRLGKKVNDLTTAFDAAQQALAAAKSPRDRSLGLDERGDILLKRNDLSGALAAYEEGLAIRRTLAKGDASSADAQRDLWVSLWRMADLCCPGHSWVDVKAQWESMRARGMVAPSDEHWTEEIDRRLASEGG